MYKALGNLIHEGVMYNAGRNYTAKELKEIPEFLRDEMFVPSEADMEVTEETEDVEAEAPKKSKK